jgi:4-hydroxythreonine-4-phosphate dehydrogenase
MRSIFDDITTKHVLDKIELTHDIMSQLLCKKPRIGVCALNPHAGDGGIFGDEEASIIEPAVKHASQSGITVTGPWPSDTLFRRAKANEFDGIVAMYHDQGHIALKLMSGFHLVNITLGLPIIRTSVAHGTAYDIVEKNCADPYSLLAAIEVACKLVQHRSQAGAR